MSERLTQGDCLTELPTVWTGCYDGSWKGLIVDDAFAHPAKFAPGLIDRIYSHLVGRYGLGPGSTIVDPFGGVALGALGAWQRGMAWWGCELEARFVEVGWQNFAKWRRYFPKAVGDIVEGDSRRLCEVLGPVLGVADVCVGSPPFQDARQDTEVLIAVLEKHNYGKPERQRLLAGIRRLHRKAFGTSGAKGGDA